MLRFALALFGVATLLLTSVFLGKALADAGPGDSTGNPTPITDDGSGNSGPPVGPGMSTPTAPFDPDAGLPEETAPVPATTLFKSVVDENLLTVPSDLSQPILYDPASGTDLQIQRTGVSSTAPVGRTSGQGIGVFLDTGEQVSTIVVDLASDETSGFAILEHIAGKQAPEEYRYEMSLPDGHRLKLQDDGSIVIIAGDDAVEPLVSSGWAFDSNGTAVPVSYSISGATIVMHVAHQSMTNVAYPVVADPCWKCLAKLAKGAVKTFSGVAQTTGGFALTVVSARFGVAPGVALGVQQMVTGVSKTVSGVRTMAKAGRENREHRQRERNQDRDGKKD